MMIIGSSHISRLNKFMESDFDLNLQHHTIKIKGYSGGKVNTLYRSLVEIHEFNLDTIILQMIWVMTLGTYTHQLKMLSCPSSACMMS